MDYLKEYKRWLDSDKVDTATKDELKALSENIPELKSRFGAMLEFGTGGLRGVMGAGLARMNVYTVRHATQGLANLITAHGEEAKKKGVVIAYDSRNFSHEFALEAARVLAASGIKTYVFDELRPTPELSYAVRELACIAGINITASHNPKQYNGYKAYWEDGAQIAPTQAEVVLNEIKRSNIFADVHVMPLEDAEKSGLIKYIGKDFDEKFIGNVLKQSICMDAVKAQADSFKIIYTPFHGAGYRLVPEVLKRLGFKNILTVPEQMIIDGNFPTVKSPNPEDKDGFRLAIEMAKKENIDLIIGTDPDADRVGIIVKGSDGEYLSLSGNQVGVLLSDYIISARKEKNQLPSNAALITTIVSTRMVFEICRRNDVKIFEVLTGFKFIGEKIKDFEKSGEYSFIFGFEESYGYLSGTYARDKDAVFGAMLIAEMAAWYKQKGMTLYDGLSSLYEKYGYFNEKTVSINMQGLDALEHIKAIMKNMRDNPPAEIDGVKVTAYRDYLSDVRTIVATGEKQSTGLPKSDVLFYEFEDGNYVVVRPSGTEPKVKLYVLVKGKSEAEAKMYLEKYSEAFGKLMS
jgi:phosphoglucomutase